MTWVITWSDGKNVKYKLFRGPECLQSENTDQEAKYGRVCFLSWGRGCKYDLLIFKESLTIQK